MTTVRERRAIMERDRISLTRGPDSQQETAVMYLITRARGRTVINPETGEPRNQPQIEAHVERRPRDFEPLMAAKRGGGQAARAFKDARVFELLIDENGAPAIGDEVLP